MYTTIRQRKVYCITSFLIVDMNDVRTHHEKVQRERGRQGEGRCGVNHKKVTAREEWKETGI